MEEELKKQQYLELFDKIFETNTKKDIDLNQLPLLSVVYERTREDIKTVSAKYKALRKKSIEVLDELQNTFSAEQQELFEEYLDAVNEKQIEMEQQIFMFGFIMAREIDRECKI